MDTTLTEDVVSEGGTELAYLANLGVDVNDVEPEGGCLE